MATEKQRSKKKWYPIVAKGEFDKIMLGESLVGSSKDLMGKTLHLNLMTLTNDPKKQGVTLVFKVTSVDGDTGQAELMGYRLSTAHVKRVVRKAIRRLDDSFTLVSKDNITFVVKPLLIARYRTNKGLGTALRKRAREVFAQVFQRMKSDEIFMYAISNRLQMDVKNDLKKIYPIAVSEIRVLERQ